jgi:hypothetical protein
MKSHFDAFSNNLLLPYIARNDGTITEPQSNYIKKWKGNQYHDYPKQYTICG